MSVSPFEGSIQICVIGVALFRIFKFADGLKLAHQTKIEKHLTCHAWIDESTVAVGTFDSKILVIRNGDCILEMTYQLPHIESSPCSSLAIHGNGMLLGLENGIMVFFQRTEDQYYYKKISEVMLEEARISEIAISPQEECAIISLSNAQIYKITMENGIVHYNFNDLE